MTKKEQIKKLTELAKGENIIAVVAQDALDYDDISYLKDVTTHGCVSGVVSSLIYYKDTHEFYQNHKDECQEILAEYEEMTGEGFRFKGQDIENTLAWLSYEQRAKELLDVLEGAI